MRFLPEQAGSRREFFRFAARGSLLAVLAAVSAWVMRPGSPGGQRCDNRGLCGGCGRFQRCELPQALSAKAAAKS